MQDLDQIHRANARAVLPELARLRGEGYHCVVEYQGVNAVDLHAFKTLAEAEAKKAAIADQVGAHSAYYAPLTADHVVEHAEQQQDSLAQQAQAALQGKPTEVSEPPLPGELITGVVQVAALVIVHDNEVASVPPHRSHAVLIKDQPGAILALCGPDTDLAAARDAAVFANAFKLRLALQRVLDYPELRAYVGNQVFDNAKAVLDAATPLFVKFERPSAEQQLAEARKDFDPAQNPSTASILDDTSPSETDPWN